MPIKIHLKIISAHNDINCLSDYNLHLTSYGGGPGACLGVDLCVGFLAEVCWMKVNPHYSPSLGEEGDRLNYKRLVHYCKKAAFGALLHFKQ